MLWVWSKKKKEEEEETAPKEYEVKTEKASML